MVDEMPGELTAQFDGVYAREGRGSAGEATTSPTVAAAVFDPQLAAADGRDRLQASCSAGLWG